MPSNEVSWRSQRNFQTDGKGTDDKQEKKAFMEKWQPSEECTEKANVKKTRRANSKYEIESPKNGRRIETTAYRFWWNVKNTKAPCINCTQHGKRMVEIFD